MRSLTVAALLLSAVAIGAPASAVAAGDGVISGAVFQDSNRDAVQNAGEAPLADKQLYLFDGAGHYVGSTSSDASGKYRFAELADGDYRVEFAAPSWWSLRDNWAPTTTPSLLPKISLSLAGSAVADFGWRPIVRSTDVSSPLSSYTGANGLRVSSYDDVVPAKDIYDAVMRGTVGPEARFVTIRFDFSPYASTVAGWQGAPGSYSNYAAICYDNYISWLNEGDVGVSHEYGHAWSLYYDTIVQQEGTLASYLKARGLFGDPRVDATYPWEAREMIAEDYRQLLGSPTARTAPQMNREIPPAAQVAGLNDFLTTTFTQPPAAPPPPPAPALSISGLSVSPSPLKASGAVAFALSASAAVTVTIRNAGGGVVRTLLSDAPRGSGPLSVAWDRKNDKGQRVKAGAYSVVVRALDAAGASVTASASFTVS
ncbi:MAG: SdrD B-like domain-containing protein [Solirubrobacteraceae bacterium]